VVAAVVGARRRFGLAAARAASSKPCTLTGYPKVQLFAASGRKLATGDRHAAAGAFGIRVAPVLLARNGVAYFAVAYGSRTGFGNLTCPASAALELTAPGARTSSVLRGTAGQIAATQAHRSTSSAASCAPARRRRSASSSTAIITTTIRFFLRQCVVSRIR
jgi:hypothetical protein